MPVAVNGDNPRVGCTDIPREAWLLTRLTITLMGYLGTSTRWMIMCGRLITFVIILLPAFVRIVWWWIGQVTRHRILRSIPYGTNARNLLDIYLPQSSSPSSPSSLPLSPSSPLSPLSPLGDNGSNPTVKKVPVVVFVSGGAWCIGYKGWGGLMGRVMAQHGVLFVAPDYRNFPQGNMSHMLDDIDNAMSWVFANIGSYGGDVNNIWLCGQSAGAHLTCMTILNQVRRAYEISTSHQAHTSTQAHTHVNGSTNYPSPPLLPLHNNYRNNDNGNGNNEYPPRTSHNPSASATVIPLSLSLREGYGWRANDLRGYIGISGAYDLVPLLLHLEGRGINRRLFTSIVGGDGERSLPLYSPTKILNHMHIFPSSLSSSPTTSTLGMQASSDISSDARLFYALPEVSRLFPRMALFHGSNDLSVPISSSQLLCESLTRCNIQCSLTCYSGKSHTDPILEDPMSGCDPLLDDILTMIHTRPIQVSSHRLINPWSVALARFVNPF